MEKRLLLILISIIVEGLTYVQPDNHKVDQAVNSETNDDSEIRENFQNLFNSIAKNNTEKSQVYHGILKQEAAREQNAFDAIKEDLWFAQTRNAYKMRNFYKRSDLNGDFVATKREVNSDSHIPGYEKNSNYKGMVRDLTNLRLDQFVSMLSSSLSKPLHEANESVYLFCLSECFRFALVGEKIMPASPNGNNLLYTTVERYYIIQLSVNRSAESALALADEYRSRYFNDGREVLVLGLNYRFVGSSRVSLQDRIVCSWVAELYNPNGTLKKSFPGQEEVYKRFAVKTDKRDNFQKLRRQLVSVYYDIMELLGKGEYSAVYACREKRTGNPFAAKFEYVHYPSHVSKEKIFVEVDIMRLLDHPNVIRMYDAFENDEEIVMIIDLMRGGTLEDRKMETGRNMSEDRVVNIVKQIAEGIKYLHDQHFVHFDLHPGNIMCETEECTHVKIIDFSKAGRLDTIELDFEKGFLEKQNYSAPEVLEGKRVGFYTDTWSLGILAYFLISGVYPFPTIHDTELPQYDVNEASLFTEYVFRDISEAGKDFLRRLLIKDRSKRMTITESLNHAWLTKAGSTR